MNDVIAIVFKIFVATIWTFASIVLAVILVRFVHIKSTEIALLIIAIWTIIFWNIKIS